MYNFVMYFSQFHHTYTWLHSRMDFTDYIDFTA